MEGVTFALRDSLELMRPLVVSAPEVRAIGGGARSALWRRMQATVFGAPVATLAGSGGPAYGAAVLAAVGAGLFDSIEDAVDQWIALAHTIDPDPHELPLYQDAYHRYRDLYPTLKSRFPHL